MQDHSKNIYKIARMKANLTQEQAAELIPCSVESVRAYETSQTVPPDDTVCRMVVVYDAPALAYHHLISRSEAARMCMPDIDIKDLPISILRLQKELNEFMAVHNELISITSDGVISEDERTRFDAIMKELTDVASAIMSLRFARCD
jgi:transcriptional regulator with XRE-family HTH domain